MDFQLLILCGGAWILIFLMIAMRYAALLQLFFSKKSTGREKTGGAWILPCNFLKKGIISG